MSEDSELWRRKMKTFFKRLDVDGDGVVTDKDIDALAKRFAALWKSTNAESDEKEIIEGFNEVWKKWTKAVTGEEKQKLTVAVFVKSIGKQMDDQEFKNANASMTRHMFNLIDLNEDGYLQEDEFRKYAETMGMPKNGWIKEAFEAIDINHDDQLSYGEFITGYFQFLYTDDDANQYNMYFGPLVDD